MLCIVSTGLICKACSLGLVHFTGKILSVCFQEFVVLTVLTLWGSGALQNVKSQGPSSSLTLNIITRPDSSLMFTLRPKLKSKSILKLNQPNPTLKLNLTPKSKPTLKLNPTRKFTWLSSQIQLLSQNRLSSQTRFSNRPNSKVKPDSQVKPNSKVKADAQVNLTIKSNPTPEPTEFPSQRQFVSRRQLRFWRRVTNQAESNWDRKENQGPSLT